jgi:NADH-ubiquinone oxidoreductase chain 5
MTRFIAGTVACLETDLKKIIALSTLRQLGLMMLRLGLGLRNFALFHLLTHALFKALLFLCAGTIIHYQQNNQDIRLMGNLSTQLPFTRRILNMANLALCGFPFLAGFYSKDLILERISNGPSRIVFILIT